MKLENGITPIVNKDLQNGFSTSKSSNEEVYETDGDEPHGRGQIGSIGHKLGMAMNRRHKEYR